MENKTKMCENIKKTFKWLCMYKRKIVGAFWLASTCERWCDMQECRPRSSVCLCVSSEGHTDGKEGWGQRSVPGQCDRPLRILTHRSPWCLLRLPFPQIWSVGRGSGDPESRCRAPGTSSQSASARAAEMRSHTNTNTHQVHSELDMPASGAKSQPAETHGYQLVQYTNRTAHTRYTHTHRSHDCWLQQQIPEKMLLLKGCSFKAQESSQLKEIYYSVILWLDCTENKIWTELNNRHWLKQHWTKLSWLMTLLSSIELLVAEFNLIHNWQTLQHWHYYWTKLRQHWTWNELNNKTIVCWIEFVSKLIHFMTLTPLLI